MDKTVGATTETPPTPAPAPGSKGEQTRAAILDTAMRLFTERGYDKTTMRAIAKEAGVSVGNAYYYFSSKEHMIQGFYDDIARVHVEATRTAIAGERDFGKRLKTALLSWTDAAEPYHGFSVQFFRNAADPDSPLSPFSAESVPVRTIVVDLYREVLAGSNLKVDPELREKLPELLWLHQMGIVLFWVYDRSPGSKLTRQFVERTTPMVARAMGLSKYRIFRPLVRDADQLLKDFLLPDPGEKAKLVPETEPTGKPIPKRHVVRRARTVRPGHPPTGD